MTTLLHKAVIPNDYTEVILDQTSDSGFKMTGLQTSSFTCSHDLTNLSLNNKMALAYVGEVKIQYPTETIESKSLINFPNVAAYTAFVNSVMNIDESLINKFRFIKFSLKFNGTTIKNSSTSKLGMKINLNLKVVVSPSNTEYTYYKELKTPFFVDGGLSPGNTGNNLIVNGVFPGGSYTIFDTFTFVFDSVTGNIIDKSVISEGFQPII